MVEKARSSERGLGQSLQQVVLGRVLAGVVKVVSIA